MPRAVFFDRDGILNHLIKREDGSYTAPWNIDEFEYVDFAKEAVSLVVGLGFGAFCVTNQPDVYDGKLPQAHLNIMNRMCVQWLGLDELVVAYERGSAWYKPNNGMIETLIKKYNIDRSQSYIIGDRWKDIVAGYKSKLTTIYVGANYTKEPRPEKYQNIFPDYIVDSTLQAATLIEELTYDD
jgi:D-glycero-D-manno-heptose 1,7-bisphosphate phosphatase